MTLGDTSGIFKWEEQPDDNKGYYFVLADTYHKCDYNVILFKDDGRVTVNGARLNEMPCDVAMAIRQRLDYFNAQNSLCNNR
jgi:hypothetical protein